MAAVLVLVVLGTALLLWQRPWEGRTQVSAAPRIPADASSLLMEQFQLLSAASSEKAFVSAAGTTSEARRFAREAWSARAALGARGVRLRYLSGGTIADRSDGSSEATVEVSWSPGDESGIANSSSHTSSVLFRMAPQSHGVFAIRGVRTISGALPLWLAGKVDVERASGTVVIRVDGGDPSLPVESMATTARSGVRSVVPGTNGDVTVISPHTQTQMAALVGEKVANVRQIAAVTTRLDGRSGTDAGTVIVLNPTVYATMDGRAGQVVLTHEATHLLTSAVGSSAATWVVEGFADYVALHDDTAPLSVSAGQILAQVKAGKAPTHLPTAADFGATRHGLGTVYESAWMIFRLLGQEHGNKNIVSFYESVLGGRSVGAALKSSFGLTEMQLTSDWRAYLTKSASTVS